MLSVRAPGGSKSLTSCKKIEFWFLSYRFSIVPTSSTRMPKWSSFFPLLRLTMTWPLTSSPSWKVWDRVRNYSCENWRFIYLPWIREPCRCHHFYLWQWHSCVLQSLPASHRSDTAFPFQKTNSRKKKTGQDSKKDRRGRNWLIFREKTYQHVYFFLIVNLIKINNCVLNNLIRIYT